MSPMSSSEGQWKYKKGVYAWKCRKNSKKWEKFHKGYSGNPLGKPKGTKNKATLAAESLLENELESISCNWKNSSTKKNWSIQIKLPHIKTSTDIIEAGSIITDAVTKGLITPSEYEALSKILCTNFFVIRLHEYEERIILLEKKLHGEKNETCISKTPWKSLKNHTG